VDAEHGFTPGMCFDTSGHHKSLGAIRPGSRHAATRRSFWTMQRRKFSNLRDFNYGKGRSAGQVGKLATWPDIVKGKVY
jgi:hypothetical protein